MLGSGLTVVGGFQFCWPNVAAVFVESAVVESVDPFQGRDFDLVSGAPRAAGFDRFGLLEAVDRLGQSIVIGVSGGPDRGVDTGLNQAFGEGHGGILTRGRGGE